MNFQLRNLPVSIGESVNTPTLGAKNTVESDVGSRAVAMSQPGEIELDV